MKYEVLFLSLVIVSILSLLVPIDSVYAPGGSNKPNKPTDVTSTLISKISVRVSWVAPTDEGASPITGYQIERKLASNTTWDIIEDDTPDVGARRTSRNARTQARTHRVDVVSGRKEGLALLRDLRRHQSCAHRMDRGPARGAQRNRRECIRILSSARTSKSPQSQRNSSQLA